MNALDTDSVEASLAALSALGACYDQSEGLSPSSFSNYDSSHAAPPCSPSNSPKNGRHSGGASLSADASDPMGGRSTSTATLEKALALASPNRVPSSSSSKGSFRLRLLKAFHAADVQAQQNLESAFERMEQGGSSSYADSSVYSDDTCLLSDTESQDESRLAPGEAFAVALLRQARRQRHLSRLRERCRELDRQAKYYVKKESEFVEQLEQLFLDKELEISELRSQAQALVDDTDHLKEVVAQQAKEEGYLQVQLDAMTTYNTSIEVRVQFIMKQLVDFLGHRPKGERGKLSGDDDEDEEEEEEEEESLDKWKEIMNQIWSDGQDNFKAGQLRLELLEKHLEAYRQDNKARAQRLSDRQVKTTGIHQKMCKLQAWILEQHLANSGERCQTTANSDEKKNAVATPPAASRSLKANLSPIDFIEGATTAPTTESGLPQFDPSARSDKGISSPSSAPGSLKVSSGVGHNESPEKDPTATAATIVPLSPPLPLRRHSEGRGSRGSTATASASGDANSTADLSPPRTAVEKAVLVQKYLCEALAAVNFSHQVVRVKNGTNIYRFGPEITAAVRLTDDGRLLAARDFGAFRPIREVLLELQADLSGNSASCSVASSLVVAATSQDNSRSQGDAGHAMEVNTQQPSTCSANTASVVATAEAAAAAAAAASAAAVRANSLMMGSYTASGTGSGSISIPGSTNAFLGPSAVINAADTGSASNRRRHSHENDNCSSNANSAGASAASSAAPSTTAGTGGTAAAVRGDNHHHRHHHQQQQQQQQQSRRQSHPHQQRSSLSQPPQALHREPPAEVPRRPPSSDARNGRVKLGYRNTLGSTEPLTAAPPPPEASRSPSAHWGPSQEAACSLTAGASTSPWLAGGSGSIDMGAPRQDLTRSFNNWVGEYVAGQQQQWRQLPLQQQHHQHYHSPLPPHQQSPLPTHHPLHQQQQQQQQQHQQFPPPTLPPEPASQPASQPQQYWSLPAASYPSSSTATRRHSSASASASAAGQPSLPGSGAFYAPCAAGRVDSRRLSLPAAQQESHAKSTSPVPQRICVQRPPVMHTVQLAPNQLSARSGTPPMRTYPNQSAERALSTHRMLRPGAPTQARATFPLAQPCSARGSYHGQSRSPPPVRNSGSTVMVSSVQAPARPVPHGPRTIRFGSVGSATHMGPTAGRSPSPPLHTVRNGESSRSLSPLCTTMTTVVEVQPGHRSVVTAAAPRRSSTPPHIGLVHPMLGAQPGQRLILDASTDYLSQTVSDTRGSPLLGSSVASSVAIASARSTKTALAHMPSPGLGPIGLQPGMLGLARPITVSQSVAQTPPCVSLRGTAHHPQGYILRPAPTIPAIPPSPASSSEVFAV